MSQTQPFFSILVPSYNRPEYLDRCIRSVLANEGVDLEVIISDDKSPRAAEVRRTVNAHASDARVRLFEQSVNLGWSENRNFLLREARGRYVLLMGDDDLLPADSLQRLQRRILCRPEVDLFGLGFCVIDEENRFTYQRRAPKELLIDTTQATNLRQLMAAHVLPFWTFHPFTLCYRQELGKEVAYHRGAGIADDLLFLDDCLNTGKTLLVLPEVFFYWRKFLSPTALQTNLSKGRLNNLKGRWFIHQMLQKRGDLRPEIGAYARSREFFEDFVIKALVLDSPSEAELRHALPLAAESLWAEQRTTKWSAGAIRRWQLASYLRLFGLPSLFHLVGLTLQQAAWKHILTRRVPALSNATL